MKVAKLLKEYRKAPDRVKEVSSQISFALKSRALNSRIAQP